MKKLANKTHAQKRGPYITRKANLKHSDIYWGECGLNMYCESQLGWHMLAANKKLRELITATKPFLPAKRDFDIYYVSGRVHYFPNEIADQVEAIVKRAHDEYRAQNYEAIDWLRGERPAHLTEEGFSFFPQSLHRVDCKGEALGDILWQGVQWAVTTYGLECRDGTYHVPLEVIFEDEKRWKHDVFHRWSEHIGKKQWCDQDDLNHALEAAMLLFNMDGTRSDVKAPFQITEFEIEEAALEAAERCYQETKKRLLQGLPR